MCEPIPNPDGSQSYDCPVALRRDLRLEEQTVFVVVEKDLKVHIIRSCDFLPAIVRDLGENVLLVLAVKKVGKVHILRPECDMGDDLAKQRWNLKLL